MSITRKTDIVYPTFAGSANSYPIDIGDYAWGAIIMASSINFTTLDFKTTFAGKDLSLTAVPGTLITMVDDAQSAIAQIGSIAANEVRTIPFDVFKYKWLILTASGSITSNASSPELMLILKG